MDYANSLGGGTSLAATLQAPERVRALALINSVAFREGLPLVGRLGFLPVAPFLSCYAPGLAVRTGGVMLSGDSLRRNRSGAGAKKGPRGAWVRATVRC